MKHKVAFFASLLFVVTATALSYLFNSEHKTDITDTMIIVLLCFNLWGDR